MKEAQLTVIIRHDFWLKLPLSERIRDM